MSNSTSFNNAARGIGGTGILLSTDASTITGARASDGAIRSSNFLVPANGAAVGAKI